MICMKICCSRGAGAPSPAVGFAAGVGERDGGARTAVLRGAGEVEGDPPWLDLAAALFPAPRTGRGGRAREGQVRRARRWKPGGGVVRTRVGGGD